MKDGFDVFFADAYLKAEEGVDYDVKNGAVCPYCGQRARVHKTIPWYGELKLRYHRCANPDCIFAQIDKCIKSWQKYTE